MNLKERAKSLTFAQLVLYISLFFVGVFYEYLSCALSIILLIWLAVRFVKKGELKVNITATLVVTAILVLFYALSILWAVDFGAAVFGFAKFLPLPLYTLVLFQEEGGREKVICGLPYVVTFMTVISVVGMYVPIVKAYFTVSERLSGFFQYPNTFALVMLVSFLLLITRERVGVIEYICMAILVFGIFYTGSRTVLVLSALSGFASLFITKDRKVKFVALGVVAIGAAGIFVYCLVTDNMWVLSRYLKFSVTESTFVGRILYVKDAFPVMLRHPFGLGFKGYYYIQQSIQTGAYSVMYIHNDILQIMLDVGWIPCLAFVGAMVKNIFSKRVSFRYKLIILVILAHCSFDFDLQFVAVFMMLLVFCDDASNKSFILKKGKVTFITVAALMSAILLYLGVSQALIRFEAFDAVSALYPYSTECDIHILKNADDLTVLDETADRIIERNKYVPVAYSVKARVAYNKGDFAKVVEYKKKTIKLAPLAAAEYKEYAYMLINGISLYTQAGDSYSADYCKAELLSLSDELKCAKEKISELGEAIDMQTKLAFPAEIVEYIWALEAENE